MNTSPLTPSVRQLQHSLDRALHLLHTASEYASTPGVPSHSALLAARLAPDMLHLAHQVEVLADAVIAVPSESQVHKQVVRKSVDLTGLVIDPQFTLNVARKDLRLMLETAGTLPMPMLRALRSKAVRDCSDPDRPSLSRSPR